MGYPEVPLNGCHCIVCDAARARVEQLKAKPFMFNVDFGKASEALADAAKAFGPFGPLSAPAPQPFEPQAEPVYTHVLMDYCQDGTSDSYCELHTATSLVEAIALRKDQAERYQVFELGDCILDVSGE